MKLHTNITINHKTNSYKLIEIWTRLVKLLNEIWQILEYRLHELINQFEPCITWTKNSGKIDEVVRDKIQMHKKRREKWKDPNNFIEKQHKLNKWAIQRADEAACIDHQVKKQLCNHTVDTVILFNDSWNGDLIMVWTASTKAA